MANTRDGPQLKGACSRQSAANGTHRGLVSCVCEAPCSRRGLERTQTQPSSPPFDPPATRAQTTRLFRSYSLTNTALNSFQDGVGLARRAGFTLHCCAQPFRAGSGSERVRCAPSGAATILLNRHSSSLHCSAIGRCSRAVLFKYVYRSIISPGRAAIDKLDGVSAWMLCAGWRRLRMAGFELWVVHVLFCSLGFCTSRSLRRSLRT